MQPRLTFVDILQQHAQANPDRHAFRFLRTQDDDEQTITYGDLHQKAVSIGAALKSHGSRGERVLLLYPPGLDFISTLFGCFYGGAVVVPTIASQRLKRIAQRLLSIIHDARPRLGLTDSSTLPMIDALALKHPEVKEIEWLATDQIVAGPAREFEPTACAVDDLAVIQYTSGSTSAPKGVMLDHANLIHNQMVMHEAFRQDERSVLAAWLPHYHDMGLIGFILHPVYLGASCVLLSPVNFLQRPFRWLEAITRFRATGTGAPNFAFELCVRGITPEERERLDLSSLRIIINGSEPVHLDTMRRFLDTFSACGLRRDVFHPCYGLAEATLLVTAPTRPAPLPVVWADAKTLERGEVKVLSRETPEARPLVGCGRALAGQRIRIVDTEKLIAREEKRTGEVWLSGESVGRGYWNDPDATRLTFNARLADDDDDALNYLRTGDIGFTLDGQLYITGRVSNLINIRGRNIFPQDIELTIEQSTPHCQPGACAAFGVVVGDEERVVVALEAGRLSAHDRRELVADVRRAVALNYELDVYAVALLEPRMLPKTSSGKIQRFACRDAYLEGRFGEVFTFEHADSEEISPVGASIRDELLSLTPHERGGRLEAHLRSLLSELIGVPAREISGSRSILDYGVDSLKATEIQHRLNRSLGCDLPLSALLGSMTITNLVAAMLDGMDARGLKTRRDEPAADAQTHLHPLSHGQRALWFIYQREPVDAAYNIGGALRINAELDIQSLSRALEALVRRHPTLRTTFEDSPHGPVQRIHKQFNVAFEIHDASDWTNGRLCETLSAEFHRPFDLTRELPLRLHLFTQSRVEHVLLLVGHHIAADFWSLGIIERELVELYHAEARGASSLLVPLKRDYADHVRREEVMLSGPDGERLWQYWRRQLEGDMTPLNLPGVRRRSVDVNQRGARQTTYLDKSLAESLQKLARAHNTTLFVVLLSAFHLLLHRYSRQSEIRVGTPSTGRTDLEFDGVVGYFANPIVLRSHFSLDIEYGDFLARMRCTVLDAIDHADYPFPLLVQRLHPLREAGVSPIFQTMFVWQSAPPGSPANFAAMAFDLPGVKSEWGPWPVESVPFERLSAQFDLTFSMAEYGGRLINSIEYRPEMFDRQTIERMEGHFESILRAIASDSAVKISRLPMLTEEEQAQFRDWNNTAVEYSSEHVLNRLFEAQAQRSPDATALIAEGRTMSFAELDSRSNQLAHHLISLGVTPGEPVGVLLERDMEMVVGILSILKAGGAYVPFSTSDPQERLTYMLGDVRPAVVVTTSDFAARISLEDARIVRLDDDRQRIEARPSTAEGLPVIAPEMLAYIMHTSGSTGRPKGVMINHRAICNRLLWMRDEYPLASSDRVLQKTPYTFDVSVWEIFLPLITGAGMVIARPDSHRDPAYLAALIQKQNVSMLHFVPSMLAAFLEEPAAQDCASLRRVICSGEALTPELQKLFFETLDAELHNLYGPTEAAVDVTYWACRRDDESCAVPIGRPIANCRIYVLDEDLNQLPVGQPGELFIGGAGLSTGYWGLPDFTADSFIPNPFSSDGSATLYRTGDRACFRPDGSLEFLGRIDQQVKVRGVRVEPGEVEAALRQHADVRDCVVITTSSHGQQPQLVAYVVSTQHASPTPGSLRRFLRDRLSEPFIPAHFQFLNELPLTPNGKIDRRALPSPSSARPSLEIDFAAPETQAERLLAEIWREVLSVEAIGADDNFFELGGDSLRILQVRSLVRKAGYEFSVQQLFEFPTIRQLAPFLRRAVEASRDSTSTEEFSLVSDEVRRSMPAHVEDAYPLSSLQEALVFHSRYDADYEIYVMSLHVRAPFDADAFAAALSKVVERHDTLRAAYVQTQRGEYLQTIHRQVRLPLEVHDLRHLAPERQQAAIRELVEAERRTRFDWGSAPLWRMLLHLRDEASFQITLSHPFYDGWSMASMLVELFTDYLSLLNGDEQRRTPPLLASFRDFVAAEQSALRSAEVRGFWQNKLAGGNASRLPRQPTTRVNSAGEYHRTVVAIPGGMIEAAKSMARSEQVPLKSVLLAAHLRVVGLITGQSEVLTGLITNGRLDEPDGDRVVGVFLNTLPLGVNIASGSWAELVRQTFRAEQRLWNYRHFPLAGFRSMLGALPFDTAFNFINFHLYEQLKGLRDFSLLGWENPSDRTYFPLCAYFNLDPVSSNLFFFLDYDTRYLSAPEIENIQTYYLNTLAAMTERPGASIHRQSLLSPREVRQQLDVWNDRRVSDSQEKLNPTHRLFEARAAENPGAIAARFDGGVLTYDELNRQANRLARHLMKLGVTLEMPVGVLTGRTQEMLLAILAIWKAGGAYVPLEPSFPEPRLYKILSDSRASLVLVGAGVDYESAPAGTKLLRMDEMERVLAQYAAANPDRAEHEDSLAYIIFTSGSTGVPKGVEITHASLINVLEAVGRMIEIKQRDVLLSVTTLAFDISALELFLPLLTGASVFVADADAARDASRLLELMRSSQATLMQATPSTWRLLIEAGWGGDEDLRILCGGEHLSRDLAGELLARAGKVWNMYGPTETTVWSTAGRVERGQEPPTIGRPLANTVAYVLDSRLNLLPVGIPGELYIGGQGVARGYRHSPEVTAERFLPDPFSEEPGARLYRTGDRVRYGEDGRLEFLGRLDTQTKIRGFRIELGEVESLLVEHPGIREAVVIVRDFAPGDRRLVAYITTRAGHSVSTTESQSHLARHLPGYMMPSAFVFLESLPLTPNGKVDRRALPEVGDAYSQQYAVEDAAQLDDLKRRLVEIWRSVLLVDAVRINDNFFDLGGHSLLLMRAHDRLRTELGIDVPLVKLFQHPTVKLLADYLEGQGREDGTTDDGEQRAHLRRSMRERRQSAVERRRDAWGRE